MIRKFIIVVLTVAGLATVVPALIVARRALAAPRRKTNVLFYEPRYGLLCFDEGYTILCGYQHCPTCLGHGDGHSRSCPYENIRSGVQSLPRVEKFRFAGIRWSVRRYPSAHTDSLEFPILWPPVILLAYPTLALIRGPVRRWRRRRKGLCAKCGYDLTGNVSGACPECGTAIVAVRTTSNVRAGSR